MALHKQSVLPQAIKSEEPRNEKSLFNCLPCRRSKRKSNQQNVKHSLKRFQFGSKISNSNISGSNLAKDGDLQTIADLKKQLSDRHSFYQVKLKKIQDAYDEQETKLNNMAMICLENAMTIEKKNTRIASLEMEIISIKSDFARERERWSHLIFDCSDPDISNDSEWTDYSVISEFHSDKPNPIREYLQVHFFEDSF